MATISQIRGMLLEEVVLRLLRLSGYRTIESRGNDPTLEDGSAGLEVIGRGCRHQIDAVADFSISIPFSNPQRLLVEAKCYKTNKRVELPTIRNGVGVLKDVGEYWVSSEITQNPYQTARSRYHYQYSVFSSSGYTRDAEQYAFAQDIYLIPLQDSKFIRPIIEAIHNIDWHLFGAEAWNKVPVNMTSLRQATRSRIKGKERQMPEDVVQDAAVALEHVCDDTYSMSGAILGMIARTFPVFLVPNPDTDVIDIENLDDVYDVHIYWDDEGWYLQSADYEEKLLFSFDLPPQLFELYAQQGVLTQSGALDLKARYMTNIQAIVVTNDHPKIVTFRLDRDWFETARGQNLIILHERPRLEDNG